MKPVLQPMLFGGVNVLFTTEEPNVNINYAQDHIPFLNSSPPEFTISIKLGKPEGWDFKNSVFKAENWFYFTQGQFSALRIYTPGRLQRRSNHTIIINANCNEGELFFEDIKAGGQEKISLTVPPFALDELLAIHLLGLNRGLMFHACGLKTNHGQGLLFAGISGSGKTSTANLWQQAGKGLLLGDERLVVRKQDGCFWMMSTAWHGSSKASTPAGVCLNELFILRHANTNHARRLKPSEAVSYLLARTFLPFWDRVAMEFSLEFLDDLCNNIPCYDLGFTLNQSAVDYVECLISS